ncbi:unnamed protein product [Schistosoma curassoni]|uniref:MSP domain-containing protein n=1 Tax=Schistosoma curassoni TaxID=6186 RepID=A0A183KPV3_9TREM|nr:unnamed protein product [Schistosoma curassoni]
MAGCPAQVLQIEPKCELVFEGPFVDVVTSYIKLTNPLDRAVGFKIKTTVPKCYCVKPSNGYIEPHQTVEVAVMLQPFSYNAAEKFNHKFMIQSIIAPDDPRPAMEQLLGPFVRPVTSIVKLTNPSSQFVCFKISASSPDHFFATPSTGVMYPHENLEVSVVFHPDDFDFTAKNRERMLIQSAVSAEEADPKKDQTVERIEASKQQTASSKPVHDTGATQTDIEKLMAEISALRQENAALKVILCPVVNINLKFFCFPKYDVWKQA